MFHKTTKQWAYLAAAVLLILVGLIGIGNYLIKREEARTSTLPPPAPASSSEPAPEPIPEPEPEPASKPDPEPAYPVGKLITTPDREAYADGSMTLTVPRLGLEAVPVSDGTEEDDMARGPSLYDYGQVPGSGNRNVCMTAHRDIFGCEFYEIDKIVKGDLILLAYEGKVYTYDYVDTKIVKATDWSPVYIKDFSCVTLISCDPIDTSLNRIIVTGKLARVEDAPPAASQSSAA